MSEADAGQGITQAERLEDKLRRLNKIPDLSENEARTLLSHPLLQGFVSDRTSSGGSHHWVVNCPYEKLRPQIDRLSDTEEDELVKRYVKMDGFNVVSHGGSVKRLYVKDILNYIAVRRRMKAEGL